MFFKNSVRFFEVAREKNYHFDVDRSSVKKLSFSRKTPKVDDLFVYRVCAIEK